MATDTRPQKITFAEMRDSGVRGILIYYAGCLDCDQPGFRVRCPNTPARSDLMLLIRGGAAPFPQIGRPLPATSNCPAHKTEAVADAIVFKPTAWRFKGAKDRD
jgi:hypothetical protein